MVKDGKVRGNQSELSISFAEMAKGMYILKLSSSGGKEADKKVIKE